MPAPDAIEEAILAFDAGTHAWGRFRHFVLSAASEAQSVPTDTVRDTLQEAAVSVEDAQRGEVVALRTAVRALLDALRAYVEALPAGVQRSELNEAIDAFDEAEALLSGRPPPAD